MRLNKRNIWWKAHIAEQNIVFLKTEGRLNLSSGSLLTIIHLYRIFALSCVVSLLVYFFISTYVLFLPVLLSTVIFILVASISVVFSYHVFGYTQKLFLCIIFVSFLNVLCTTTIFTFSPAEFKTPLLKRACNIRDSIILHFNRWEISIVFNVT